MFGYIIFLNYIKNSLLIMYTRLFDLLTMGKFTKMDKHRMARDKAKRDAPFKEMEDIAKDKKIGDSARINNYSRVLTLAIRQKKYSEAIKYADILAGYYRTYDMHSRLLSLKNRMVDLERQVSRQTQGRIGDKVRAKTGVKRVKTIEVEVEVEEA
jgi:hypothetical protein